MGDLARRPMTDFPPVDENGDVQPYGGTSTPVPERT
nr:MAG TPA_asm: hypothetical protein [Caudoviricetes sp.]